MVDERDWKSLFGKEENTHIRISVKGATSAMVDVLRAFPLDVQNLVFFVSSFDVLAESKSGRQPC